MREHIEQVKAQSEQWRPRRSCGWAFSTFRQDFAIASGGGVEGMVLLDIATKVNPKPARLYPRHRISFSRNLRAV